MLSQHLSLNQEIPEGWGAGKERSLEIRRTLEEKSISCADNVSPECISNMAFCQNVFLSFSAIKDIVH